MQPQRPPSPQISLPGIHEMFPEYLMKAQAPQNAGLPPAYASGPPGNLKLSGDFYARPPSRSSRPLDKHDRSPRRGFTSGRATQPHIHASTGRAHVPYAAPSPPPHGPTNEPQAPAPAAATPSSPANLPTHRIDLCPGSVNAPTYSFSVFRSDPATASLEHITSSTTLRSHTALPQRNQATGIADGSVPAFTVVVSEPVTPEPSTSRGAGAPTDERQRDGSGYASSAFSVVPLSTAAGCSSFPVSDTTRQSHDTESGFKTSARDLGQAIHYSSGNPLKRTDKLHECQHCLKRFNRPSSLRIHANTHTGARPFHCPFAGCGREFNVNSNMRRHYRNHARGGAQEGGRVRMRRASESTSPRPTLSSPSTHSARLSPSGDSDEILFAMDDADDERSCSSGSRSSRSTASHSPGDWGCTRSRPLPRSLSPACARRGYTSSSPVYARSCTELQVSTVLRPAFGAVCREERR